MSKKLPYRFNRIASVRYEQYEKLSPELRRDPDVIAMWADQYWQPIPKQIITYLTEIVQSYNSDTGDATRAETDWVNTDFKDAVAEKLARENGIHLNEPEKEIGTCHGAAEGFACACGIFLEPGDEVLVLDPQFTFAWGLPDLHGARTVSVPLREESGWDLRPEEVPGLLEPLITDKTKMMIAAMPSNPTGAVFSRETTRAIGDVLRDRGIIYLEDAVYERRTYGDRRFVSMASLPGMREWTVTLMGFSKIYNVGSFRVGYVVADEEIIDKVWRWHMLGGIDPPAFLMKTCAKALRRDMAGPLPPIWHQRFLAEWNKMRLRTYDALRETPAVSLSMPMGGTFHFLNVSRLGTSDEIFAYLRDRCKVLLTPGNWYGPGGEGYMRLCYAANSPEKTMEGTWRVVEALTGLAREKGLA